jgi:hypothetical protein
MKVDSPSKKKVGSPLKEKKKDSRNKIAGPSVQSTWPNRGRGGKRKKK